MNKMGYFSSFFERLDEKNKAETNKALHDALLSNDEKTVKLLLEHGADVNSKNNLGFFEQL